MLRSLEIPFGEWLPDYGELHNPGALTARNAIPAAAGYVPLKALNVFASALDARCRGACSATNVNGAVFTYAGSATKLYRLVDATMADASKPGGYALSADDMWEFIAWGNQVLAVCITEPAQAIAMGGTQFADLVASSRRPRARHVAAVRDFVVLGNTADATDGSRPSRVWWSAINDAADFDPSDATQCSFQDLPTGGAVQKVLGGEYGVILQERAIQRMSYEGPPAVFRFDQVEALRGAVAAGGATQLGRLVFYLAEDGFYVFTGAASQPIGKNKVDRSFWREVDRTHIARVTAAADPVNSVVAWAYPGPGNADGRPNMMLLYNWVADRWAKAEIETQHLFPALATGYSLDGLDGAYPDLDAMPVSLDDRRLAGGAALLAGFDAESRLGFFDGPALDATIDSGEVQVAGGRRAFVAGVRPLVEGGGTVTVKVGTRDRAADAATWSAALPLNAFGEAETRANARYHRFRIAIAGGFASARGVEVRARSEGIR